ncbi:MAG: DUF6624 domain-containing protein, partial [Bacteroidota bacterium]
MNDLQSQSFRSYYLQADSLHRAGDFLEASLMYDKAFELRKEIAYGFYYNPAYNNALAGNKRKSIEQFEKLIAGGFIDFNLIVDDEKLQVLHEEPGWSNLLKIIEERELELDRKLVAELKILDDKDQMFRQLSGCREQRLTKTQNSLFSKFIETQDSLNLISITDIIDQNGWPGKKKVGAAGNMTVWLIIQHADISTQEKYLPILEESVLQGESQAKHLAMLQDRILMRKGLKQKYGSQVRRNRDTNQYEIYPIEDVEDVDKRREAIGLAPMDEYLQRWKLTMKANYPYEVEE